MAYANIKKCGLYQDDCREYSQKTKTQENLEQLQGSLCKSVQGKPKIIQDFKYQMVCRECAIRTSQCGAFHQDAAGPHPGYGKSRNSDKSKQNLSRAVDKGNIGALNPICYSNRETSNSTVREWPSGKIGTSFGLRQVQTLGVQQSDPPPIRLCTNTTIYIQWAGTNSTLIDIAQLTGTR